MRHSVAAAPDRRLLAACQAGGASRRRQEVRVVIAVFLMGVFLEYLQHLIYHNTMEWRDVRDDALAILAGFAAYRLAGRRNRFFGAIETHRP